MASCISGHYVNKQYPSSHPLGHINPMAHEILLPSSGKKSKQASKQQASKQASN
jgi:hypothetical protein